MTLDRAQELEGYRIGVTGAGGFIGLALCSRLVSLGAAVVGLESDQRRAAAVHGTGAEPRALDITDADAATRGLSDCPLVVHTAALVSEGGRMSDFIRVNVRGTRNVLEAARRADARRVVHISSVAVWGYEFPNELDAGASPRPCGAPYIDTKGASDQMALRAGAVVVRPGDVYGPGSVPWAIRPLQALRRGLLFVPRDGGGWMTPVYVQDLVDCLVLALRHPDAKGAFTAWDGHAVRASEFFAFYARMLGRPSVPSLPRPLLRLGAAAQELAGQMTRTTPAVSRQALTYVSRRALFPNDRARRVLGWRPRTSLAEGMADTERWFRAQGML